jgi:hypothetical protein
VDLSEAQMKNSEATNAPLSSRQGVNNALSKAQLPSNNTDSTVSKNRYGVSMKKGNFRRTQEDRVSITNSISNTKFLSNFLIIL